MKYKLQNGKIGKLFILCLALVSLKTYGQTGLQSDWQKTRVIQLADKENNLRCDSIVKRDYDNNPLEKIVNGFDAGGRLTSRIRQSYNGMTKQYINSEKHEYLYDDYGNVSISIYSKWNELDNSWIYQEKTEEDFNEKGNKTSQRNYTYSSEWQMISRGDATYDAAGNELTNVIKSYNQQDNKWIKSKNEYTYNSMNLPTSATFFGTIPDEQEFVPTFRTVYEYNDKGDMLLRQSEDWDTTSFKYVPNIKETWNYDTSGNMTTQISWFKDFDSGELKEITKHENSYDQRGNLLTDLFYNKDSQDQWQLSQKTEYTYNSMDSVLTMTKYGKAIGATDVSPQSRTEYTYDDKGNILTLLSSFYGADGSWTNSYKEDKSYNADSKVLTQNRYNWSIGTNGEGEWQLTFKGVYGYDEGLRQTAIEEQRYDAMQGVWVGLQKSETQYDQYGNILQEKAYQWVSSSFMLSGTLTYYYSSTSRISDRALIGDKLRVLSENGLIMVLSAGTPIKFTAYSASGQKLCNDVYTMQSVKGKIYLLKVAGKGFKAIGR